MAYYDQGSGRHYVRERVYDAKTGTWVSVDPLKEASGDDNFYAYCGNNPVNGLDASGLGGVYQSLHPAPNPNADDLNTNTMADSWEMVKGYGDVGKDLVVGAFQNSGAMTLYQMVAYHGRHGISKSEVSQTLKAAAFGAPYIASAVRAAPAAIKQEVEISLVVFSDKVNAGINGNFRTAGQIWLTTVIAIVPDGDAVPAALEKVQAAAPAAVGGKVVSESLVSIKASQLEAIENESLRAEMRRQLERFEAEAPARAETGLKKSMPNKRLMQNAANWADKQLEGNGHAVGSRKHRLAEIYVVTYQRVVEEHGILTEQPYVNGNPELTNRDGGVRFDGLTKPASRRMSYDYKFGDAKLRDAEIANKMQHGPRELRGVREIKPKHPKPP